MADVKCSTTADDGDDFYETIQAPKFVDLTLADRHRPDDRYWFCLRAGCDQKHEEELNIDEITRSFRLRVMAARSPNVALLRKNKRALRCPQSAPSKNTACTMPSSALFHIHPSSNSISTPVVKTLVFPSPSSKDLLPKGMTVNNTVAKKPQRIIRRDYEKPWSTAVAKRQGRGRRTGIVESCEREVIGLRTASRSKGYDAVCETKSEAMPLRVRKMGGLFHGNGEFGHEESRPSCVPPWRRGPPETEEEDEDKENVPECRNLESKDNCVPKGHHNRKPDRKASRMKPCNLQSGCHRDGMGSAPQIIKCEKRMATKTKPFRLRTHERGILKEANLERKFQDHQQPTSLALRHNNVVEKKQRMHKRVEETRRKPDCQGMEKATSSIRAPATPTPMANARKNYMKPIRATASCPSYARTKRIPARCPVVAKITL